MRTNRVQHLLEEKAKRAPNPFAGLRRLLEREERGKIWAWKHGRNQSYERIRVDKQSATE
mgnify:CR=1 FL=1|jgi:hypothetical protein